MHSPFDCRNDSIDFFKTIEMKKNAKISFIISILYLIICFIKIIFEFYLYIVEYWEKIKKKKQKQKKEKEKEKEIIKTNLINSENDSELIINL